MYFRETLKEAGYIHVKTLEDGRHLLEINGRLEIWGCNKNHAGYALIYKNTHLEFITSRID